ncbi:hypothetical protein ACP70R_027754 [Stipagrostis hirtigluma subsp. patula]
MLPTLPKEETFGDLNHRTEFALEIYSAAQWRGRWIALICCSCAREPVVQVRGSPFGVSCGAETVPRLYIRERGGRQLQLSREDRVEKKSPEMSPPRRSSPAATAGLLLLFAVFFCESLASGKVLHFFCFARSCFFCGLFAQLSVSGPGSPAREGSPADACVGAPGGCETDLQKHAAFFDHNGDGVITVYETINAFRSLGFGIIESRANALLINAALAAATRPENASSSSSFMNIYIENIHKGIHGSDTGSYDCEGMFVPEKFDEIFAKHAKTEPDALTSGEVDEMLYANRDPGDLQGWAAATLEWRILYNIAKDQQGFLRKDAVRGVYDGSLFSKLVQEKASSQKPRRMVRN